MPVISVCWFDPRTSSRRDGRISRRMTASAAARIVRSAPVSTRIRTSPTRSERPGARTCACMVSRPAASKYPCINRFVSGLDHARIVSTYLMGVPLKHRHSPQVQRGRATLRLQCHCVRPQIASDIGGRAPPHGYSRMHARRLPCVACVPLRPGNSSSFQPLSPPDRDYDLRSGQPPQQERVSSCSNLQSGSQPENHVRAYRIARFRPLSPPFTITPPRARPAPVRRPRWGA